MANKPKLAFYWASSCGGCEISLVNVHEVILDVAAAFDLVFCPCLVDTKKKDVEAMPDQSIAICFFNGAIRTAENEEMADLLRRKARVLIAYGACAYGGGIPALSNLHSGSDMFKSLFLDNPTIDNPGNTLPQAETLVPEGVLRLSPLRHNVASLRDVVEVDFFFPGCPPESKQLVQFIQCVIDKQPFPIKGSVVGAGKKAVCDECERKFIDGKESGVYCATPLARLNVSDGMPTPRAQVHFDRLFQTLGSGKINGRYRPVHHRLATHWARLIELLYAAERMLELASDPEITSDNIRNIPSGGMNPAGGIAAVEAPRGTLTHHYEADEKGLLTKVNLIVGTTNNHAPISMSVKRAAEKLINGGEEEISEGLLNKIEMAFRLYDPCFSCATHTLPGNMPLVVTIRAADGRVVKTLRRD